MTLEHYNSLTEEKRSFVLDKAGAFVGATFNKHYEFNLFMLSSFYVEVIYKIDGTLCGSRAFTAVSQLDRYLNSIDISPLMVQ
ncbi:MAG: hypothetical protein ABIT58_06250 [Ferruginibacter sp.]